MKRGERQLWRELSDAAGAIATSTNHAEEYMAKLRLVAAERAMEEFHAPLLFAAVEEGDE